MRPLTNLLDCSTVMRALEMRMVLWELSKMADKKMEKIMMKKTSRKTMVKKKIMMMKKK